MRRRLLVMAVPVVLGAFILGSCSRGGDATPKRDVGPLQTASSPSPKPTAGEAEACRLLTSKERRSIAGEWMNDVAPDPTATGYRQCRWVVSFSEPQPRSILVLTMKAHTWASSLAVTQIDQLLTTRVNDEKTIRQLHAAKMSIINQTDKLSDKKACGIFSLVVAKSTKSKRSSEIVAYLPAGSALSVNGMMCTHGVFTLVKYTEQGLHQSGVLEQAALRLVHLAHKRAVKLKWSARD